MGTLYFLLIIMTTVSLLAFIANRINSASFLKRAANNPAERPRSAKPECRTERLEQKYVDWYMNEGYARAELRRKRAQQQRLEAEEKECLVGHAFITNALPYEPQADRSYAIH